MAEPTHTIGFARSDIPLLHEALTLKVAQIDQGLASIRRTERMTSADARAIFPGYRLDEQRRLRCQELIAHLKSLPL
jgi:hypothetical protein